MGESLNLSFEVAILDPSRQNHLESTYDDGVYNQTMQNFIYNFNFLSGLKHLLESFENANFEDVLKLNPWLKTVDKENNLTKTINNMLQSMSGTEKS